MSRVPFGLPLHWADDRFLGIVQMITDSKPNVLHLSVNRPDFTTSFWSRLFWPSFLHFMNLQILNIADFSSWDSIKKSPKKWFFQLENPPQHRSGRRLRPVACNLTNIIWRFKSLVSDLWMQFTSSSPVVFWGAHPTISNMKGCFTNKTYQIYAQLSNYQVQVLVRLGDSWNPTQLFDDFWYFFVFFCWVMMKIRLLTRILKV